MEDKEKHSKPKKRSNKHIEYKGVHYNKEKQVRYYEFNAHFKYQELYDILFNLNKAEAEATNCDTASLTNRNNEKFISQNELRNNKKTSSDEIIKISKKNTKSPKDSFGDIVITDEETDNNAKRISKVSNSNDKVINNNLYSNKNIKELKHLQINKDSTNKVSNKNSIPVIANMTNTENNIAYPNINTASQKINKVISSVEQNKKLKNNINQSFGNIESKINNWNSIPIKQDKTKSTIISKKPIENPESILPKINTGLKTLAPMKRGM